MKTDFFCLNLGLATLFLSSTSYFCPSSLLSWRKTEVTNSKSLVNQWKNRENNHFSMKMSIFSFNFIVFNSNYRLILLAPLIFYVAVILKSRCMINSLKLPKLTSKQSNCFKMKSVLILNVNEENSVANLGLDTLFLSSTS